ncbi:MAG: heparinase, partial [Lentisphaeria bacterium]|nr:heparinase [Lentisphaeria bacterium]
MLRQQYSLEQLRSTLIPSNQWRPFPVAADRQAWSAVPTAVREAYLAEAAQKHGYAWPELPATLFMGYARKGNRSEY